MRNFSFMRKTSQLLSLALFAVAVLSTQACDETEPVVLSPEIPSMSLEVSPRAVARMLADLPLGLDQVKEVHDAVDASSLNGYDEEYTFADMFSSPGRGVGDELSGTRSAVEYSTPLSSMVSGDLKEGLSSSGLQIYWPYSEDWDGRSMPVITYGSELALESNIGFMRESLPDGSWIVKEITVNEEYAKSNPVWVVNWNEDAGAMTPQMLAKLRPEPVETRTSTEFKTLRLKEFKAHNQYDSWLSGGSEFFIKCGSLKAFTAEVAADLTKYTPEITDLMIKVKRRQVGSSMRYNTILVSEWSPQLTECVFLIHEDDGGKMTTWKATGEVKIKSKSYGFTVEFPYHRNDDIVWRGKLSSNFFEKNNGVANRYGDTSVTFTFN